MLADDLVKEERGSKICFRFLELPRKWSRKGGRDGAR
jgi:hypothetical protein